MFTKQSSGFTLIEILVSISILAILFSFGVTTYIDFNRRQLVAQTAKNIAEDLRLTQSYAENNQKPTGCDTLQSYSLDFNLAQRTYTINAHCSADYLVKPTVQLPSVFTFAGFTQMKFKILRQGWECTPLADPCSLSVTGFGLPSQTIVVEKGGVIKIQ